MPLGRGLPVADDASEDGILTFAEILAKLPQEAKPSIVALKTRQPVRHVVLNWDKTIGTYRRINFERPGNQEALLVQATGDVAEQPCKLCVDGHGPFAECVTAPNAANGACANCHYNSGGARCKYHHGAKDQGDNKRSAPPEDPQAAPISKRGRMSDDAIVAVGNDHGSHPQPADPRLDSGNRKLCSGL
ncbi:hypothetical protein C8A01DRAFT_39028 [Parachaetomium inaequale]|uniref:Uncharacterized protein n=1 Tax=Parachaetomium inaequale TaxID=2588326 RepID=A0AAN6PBV8_9PEZI|nr:hypothetical protein C8A01DRAFT_39028 [Parachaetomium inaequale]